MEAFPQTSFRDLASVFFKRKWSIGIILVVALLSAIVWVWFIRDDMYEATAKVLVKIGREQSPPPTVLGAPPTVVGWRYQDVNSEIDILQSADLLLQVVDRLGLDKPSPPPPVPDKLIPRLRYRAKRLVSRLKDWRDEWLIRLGLRERLTPREKALAMFQQGLAVKSQKDSNIIVAALALPNRQTPSIILNTLLYYYQGFRLTLYQDENGLKFFQDEVARKADELHLSEEQLQGFESAWNISLLDKQEETLLEQIAQAQAAQKTAEVSMQEAASRVDNLERELESKDPNSGSLGDVAHDSFLQSMLRELASLQKQREQLRMTDLDSSDRIQNNRQQFNALLAIVESNVRSALAEKEQTYRIRRDARLALQDQLKALQDKRAELTALQRRVRTDEEEYLFYSRKLEQATADAELEKRHVGNVAVVERATDPLAPSGRRKTTLLALVFGVGVFFALAWVSVAEYFDHRIYTVEDLKQHFGAPVIAVVPARKALAAELPGAAIATRVIGTHADRD